MGAANGGDAPVSKKLDMCDLVGQAGVAGPWCTVVREVFLNQKRGRKRAAG